MMLNVSTVPFLKTISIAAMAVLVVGCASVPPATDVAARAAFDENNDRLEPLNRAIFGVDQALDAVLIRPIAWTYREVVPDPARRGVTNFLRNLRSPITLANNVLQGDLDRAGQTIGRFVVNTTFGVLGFGDVATGLGVPYHYEDFGQTLGKWGVGDGSYLYLPIIGPSSIRDSFGLAVDSFAIDPMAWYSSADNPGWVRFAYFGSILTDVKASTMATTDELKASSIDYYAALRSAYRQNRAKELRNGSAAAAPTLAPGEEDPFAVPAASK
jgi:phospholipid-binding lipoprotein MlaA